MPFSSEKYIFGTTINNKLKLLLFLKRAVVPKIKENLEIAVDTDFYQISSNQSQNNVFLQLLIFF